MAKLKRGATTARGSAARADKQRSIRQAKARTGSALDAAMAYVPFSDATLHRIFLAIILGGAAALAWLIASLAGVPAMAAQQLAMVARQAGFEVQRVEVRGTHHLNELQVYERVLEERDRAMPLVDLDTLRGDLMQLSWVADARVSRQLPDTLVVDIVERQPHAVLRAVNPDGTSHLVLIDDTGRRLDAVSAARARGQLILAGDGVEGQVGALDTLLDAAPAMRPQVAEADWIGNRRWNLVFKTGQLLELPEGGDPAAGALQSFARLDGTNRLIGGKAVAFDLRAPDRIYFRVPGRAEAAAEEAAGRAHALSDLASGAPAATSTLAAHLDAGHLAASHPAAHKPKPAKPAQEDE